MISLYGTAGSMAKMTVQQTKVEQKKREGFVKEGGLMVKYQKTPEELREYAVSLYSLIFELSRSYQSRLLGMQGEGGRA